MDTLGGDMGMPQDNMNSMPPQGDDMNNSPMGDDAMMGNDGQGFDAEVEADPIEDPKKYLQQLSGKLSQELRKYNEDQEQPDEDLNKYVAGMIIPQATKGLTDKGKKEVIAKIKKGSVDDPIEDDSSEIEEPSNEEENEMPMESVALTKKRIMEIFRKLGDDDEEDERQLDKISNKTLPKRNPFRSGR